MNDGLNNNNNNKRIKNAEKNYMKINMGLMFESNLKCAHTPGKSRCDFVYCNYELDVLLFLFSFHKH